MATKKKATKKATKKAEKPSTIAEFDEPTIETILVPLTEEAVNLDAKLDQVVERQRAVTRYSFRMGVRPFADPKGAWVRFDDVK